MFEVNRLTADTDIIGQIILDDYQITEVLGRGSACMVFKVRHLTLNTEYAVKMPIMRRLASKRFRQLFFREIRTWIDLPNHPNISRCLFIKTWHGKILIFSEYIDGGSLREWVAQKRVTDISQVIDIAIQVCWGLGCAHDFNVVHKDIKPANILMTSEGIAKLTDFGLARVHELREPSEESDPISIENEDIITEDRSNAILPETQTLTQEAPQQTTDAEKSTISSGIMTPAYCSPEQSDRLDLGPGTDIWSYGLTILTLFTGPPRWMTGCSARGIHSAVLSKGSSDGYPELHPGLSRIFFKCFMADPADRWQSMNEISHQLITLYHEISGVEYFRTKPEVRKSQDSSEYDRLSQGNESWPDPMIWVNRALKASGKDQDSIGIYSVPMEGSRDAKAFIDLEIYQEVLNIYEEITSLTDEAIATDLAVFLTDKAIIHKRLKDFEGAIDHNERALGIFESILKKRDGYNQRMQLAMTYNNTARTYRVMNRLRDALRCYNRGIEVFGGIVTTELDTVGYKKGSLLFMNKANVLLMTQEFQKAIDNYEIAERMIHSSAKLDPSTSLDDELSYIYINQGNANMFLGQLSLAAELFQKAIVSLEKLVYVDGIVHLAINLAQCYSNSSIVARNSGDYASAIDLSNESIRVLSDLIYNHGKTEHLESLAVAYLNKANNLNQIGSYLSALKCNQKCLDIAEPMVYDKGRDALILCLCKCYYSCGNAERGLGNLDRAQEKYDESIRNVNLLVHDKKQPYHLSFKATIILEKTRTFIEQKQYDSARHSADLGLETLTRATTQSTVEITATFWGSMLALKALSEYKSGNKIIGKEIALDALAKLESASDKDKELPIDDLIIQLKEIIT